VQLGLANGRGLPEPLVPFPVEPAYRIQPDLRRLRPADGHFRTDSDWPAYLARKLELLSADPESCRVFAGSEHLVAESLWEIAQVLAAEQPRRFVLDGDRLSLADLGLAIRRDGTVCARAQPNDRETDGPLDGDLLERVNAHLAELPSEVRLADAIALAVQEDLVLMGGPPGDDRALFFHVCFPSYWNPRERRGASFARLHGPVPHNSRLLAGSRNMLAAMLAKGPFERHVWSLTPTPDLDQNPSRSHGGQRAEGSQVDRLWFRAERQTTRALSACALFTIRVYAAPLRRVLEPEGRAQLLAAAIRSMDSELLSYKGLTERRDELLEELDAYGPAA
jgi:hypothetical protein